MLKIVLLLMFIFQNSVIKNYIINPDTDKNVNFSLSDISSEIKYVKLEASEQCLVASVKKVLINDQFIFLLSHQGAVSKLLLFDNQGKFIREIGTPGRAPGAYSSIHDFAIDNSGEIVYILDTSGKILLYNFKGIFIRSMRIDSRPTGILFLNNALFLFNSWPDYFLNKGYGVTIKHLDLQKQDTYLLNRKQVKYRNQQGILIYPNYAFSVNRDNSVYFFEDKFDTLYTINSNHEVSPKCVLSLINKWPRELYTGNEYSEAVKKYNTVSRYIITDNHIFFTVLTPKHSFHFYRLNISTGQILKHEVDKDNIYISNDYDGGFSFIPQGEAKEGVLYSVIECSLLKEHVFKPLKNDRSGAAFPNNELQDLSRKSLSTDNPILMFVKLSI